ncbi:ABC transporter ATP-binding protein, partial [Candidatus Woesearchaeota archaeon]|nr:ABC transporter ATP-binding protein [Candidatus Woesearchaeota archaeon]
EQLCGRIGIINAGRLVKLADKSRLMKEGKLQDIFLRLTKSRQADGYG